MHTLFFVFSEYLGWTDWTGGYNGHWEEEQKCAGDLGLTSLVYGGVCHMSYIYGTCEDGSKLDVAGTMTSTAIFNSQSLDVNTNCNSRFLDNRRIVSPKTFFMEKKKKTHQ